MQFGMPYGMIDGYGMGILFKRLEKLFKTP